MKKFLLILCCCTLGIAVTAMAQAGLQNCFVGAPSELALKNIQKRLDLDQEALTYNKQLTFNIVKQLNARAPKEIAQALQPFGYFKPKITSKLEYDDANGTWYATYYIDAGPPLKITSLDVKVTGAATDDPEFTKLLQRFPVRQGDIFVAANYKKAKLALFALALSRGYLKAKMEQSVVKISLNNYTADITIHFTSGPRYCFGQVTFITKKFNKQFLQRFVTFTPGSPFTSAAVQKTQLNFHDSNLFKNAVVRPQLNKTSKQQIPILIKITPKQTLHYSVGAGYGTDTGFRGLLGLQLNNLTPGKATTSKGQHFIGNLRASQTQTEFEASYIIPGCNPTTDKYDISAGSEIENYKYGDGGFIKGGPGYTTIVHCWQQTIRVNLMYENWKFDNQNNHSYSTLVVPSITWLRSKTNGPIRPTKGYHINASIQAGQTITNPVFTFGQITASGKIIYPLLKSTLLVVRGTLGYTLIEGNNVDKLPMSFWYSAGGAQSVRGFRYQAIGPGTELSVGSVELRQRVFGNWYLAAFFDAGNAGDDIFNIEENTLDNMFANKGAGVGIVWLSPIGAIQLSFARDINDPDEYGIVQFTMGPEL